MKTRVLYLSYSGMLEPLGQSQVLSYQEQLVKKALIHIVSFERADDWADLESRFTIQRRMDAAGIAWHPVKYHKRPSALATAWDIFIGTIMGIYLVKKYELNIVHARSYVPSVMALAIKKITGAKYLFDIRGFWADERVDGGLWVKNGRMYKFAKWFERRFFLNADHVVSLTHAARHEIESYDYLLGKNLPISVIPTCADLQKFRILDEAGQGSFTLGYVGSAGTWYLFDEVVRAFKKILEVMPEARFRIVNHNDHEYIQNILSYADVPEDKYDLLSVEFADVPRQMSFMNAGIFFYKPSYSRIACSPTKLGEFLGCGVPCLSNTGVGDMEQVLDSNEVGVTVSEFSETTLMGAVEKLIDLAQTPGIEERCRKVSEKCFSLEEGVKQYDDIYESLLE